MAAPTISDTENVAKIAHDSGVAPGRPAAIHTNDEFEDLAASFNRMLRHLSEGQAELEQVNSMLDGKVDEILAHLSDDTTHTQGPCATE